MKEADVNDSDMDMFFPGSAYIRKLAEQQKSVYRAQPKAVVSHYNQENQTLDDYRRRHLLELLQNADDAGEGFRDETHVLLRLSERYLIVANTGKPFTSEGIDSLVIPNVSPKQLGRNRYIGNKGL